MSWIFGAVQLLATAVMGIYFYTQLKRQQQSQPRNGRESAKEMSDDLKNLTDPSDNLVFEAHCYFDHDGSGIYRKGYDEEGAYPTVGIDRVRPFVDWLQRNHKRGFVGEYGVPGNDSRWLECLDLFLAFLTENGVNGTYWAAGSRWNKYILGVHPVDNYSKDQPQTAILTKYQTTH